MISLLSRSALVALLALLFSQVQAQTIVHYDKCGAVEADSSLRAHIPGAPTTADFEQWLSTKITEYKMNHTGNQRMSVITIPTVVHVIHNGDAVGQNENISAAQVYSQIDVLNEDFRRHNADTVNTPSMFQSVAADIGIEFCLAQIDPNGNVMPEPGIDRVNAGQSTWGNTSDIDATLKPSTIWDPNQYFNIWTVDFGNNGLLGYAQFPEGSGLAGMPTGAQTANSDGIVILYNAFGRVGNLDPTYDLGRTATHETGHWLGLRHIWGDGGCSVDDYCNDTPVSDAANRGCDPTTTSCSSIDMVQNYMDYTDDDCMNLFTQDQKDRMVTVMANCPRRVNLLNSIVCTIPNPVIVQGQVRDINTLQGVPGAKVRFIGTGSNLDFNTTCDANGNFIDTLFQGTYNIYAGQWGFRTVEIANQTYNSSPGPLTIDIDYGYYDDFVLNFNWTENSTASTGIWVRGVPIGTTYNGDDCNPGVDVANDFGSECFVTGNGGGAAGNDDIDGGYTRLTSPVFDLSSYNEPYISYYRWFYNAGGSGTPDDNLTVSISNGSQTVQVELLDVNTANSNQWNFNNIRVRDFVTPTANMTFILESSDGVTSSTGHLVEAALDRFEVVDSQPNTSLPPVAIFGVSQQQICAGDSVIYYDNSTNQPTSWLWSFPGGSPASSTQENPVVTYSTPGTYSASLVVGNAFGFDTLSQSLVTVTGPNPSFSANATDGCVGLVVQFTDASTCNPTNWQWTFPGGTPSTSTQQNPIVTYNSTGSFDVTLSVNGNSTTSVNYITVSTGSPVTALSEDFESGTFGATGWSVDNPDGNITWDLYSTGGNGPGTQSAGILLRSYNSIGQRDGLISPVLDLSTTANTTLDFKHAYRRDNASAQDSLIIYVSTDGGATYPNRVFAAAENGTGTFATGTTIGAAFTPATADDWCFSGTVGAGCFTVDLSAFDGMANVRLRFETYNASENNIYIDDVEVTGTCTAPPLSPIADFSSNTTSGCGSLTVNFLDQSLNSPTNWLWTFQGGTPSTSTSQFPTGISYSTPGTYDVTLTVWNATDTNSVTVNDYIEVFSVPAISISTTDVSCAGGSDGTATASVSGGTAPFTYTWSNGGTQSAISNLAAGTYTVTVSDRNGCSSTAQTTIGEPTVLVVTSGSSPAYCGSNNGSASVSVSGGSSPYTYSWSNGGTNDSISNVTSGSYGVTVTDSHGCIKTSSVTINSNNITLSVNFSITNVSCNGGSNGAITATVSGGSGPYNYNWSTGQITATISNLASGNYAVTVSDVNGCSTSTSVYIGQPAAISISGTVSNASCGNTNGSIAVNASGGQTPYSFSWSTGGSGNTLSNLGSGSYGVTVTDGNGCTSSDSYNVSNQGGPTLTTSKTDVSCNSGSDGTAFVSIVGGNGPYTILWSTGGTTDTVQGLAAGSYSVTVTDNNSCSSVASVNITQPTALSISLSNQNATCGQSNGKSTATGSGGTAPYSFAWSNGAFGITTTTLAPGANSVTITDGNGCTASQSFTIGNSSGPNVTLSNTAVSCSGGLDGTATANVSGGATPYAYSWSNNTSTATISGLMAGTYSVTVTDANGCTTSGSTTVADGSTILLTVNVTDATCGIPDGSLTTSVSGGHAPYTYLWSSGQVSSGLNNIPAGVYNVTVTDAAGCYADTFAIVSNLGAPSVAVNSGNISCKGAHDGYIDLNVSGGQTPYTYDWNNGANSASLNNLAPGPYSVTVTDGNGCNTVRNVTLTEPDSLLLSIATTDVSCGQNNGSAVATVTGGTTPYTYAWSNGASIDSISNLAPGGYVLTVTDMNGCSVIKTVLVNNVNPPSITTQTTQVSCYGASDGCIEAQVGFAVPPVTFEWSSGDTSAQSCGLPAGTYTVTVTDGNGCVFTYSDNITQPTQLTVNLPSTVYICGSWASGVLLAIPSGGTGAYSYNWSTGSTINTTAITQSGTYYLTVTDAGGCSAEDSLVAIVYDALVVDASSTADTNGLGLGTVTVNAQQGTAPFSYDWSTGATTQTVDSLAAGTYIVTVVDANGCSDQDTIVVDLYSGIKPNALFSGVSLYPNPTTGQVTIELTGIDKDIKLQVFDAVGRLVVDQQINTAQNKLYTMDMSTFAEGVYYVQLLYGTERYGERLILTTP